MYFVLDVCECLSSLVLYLCSSFFRDVCTSLGICSIVIKLFVISLCRSLAIYLVCIEVFLYFLRYCFRSCCLDSVSFVLLELIQLSVSS